MKNLIFVEADYISKRFDHVRFTDPFTGESKEVDGELVSMDSRDRDYFHKNEDGSFSSRKWYDEDITHVCVHCDYRDWENGIDPFYVLAEYE